MSASMCLLRAAALTAVLAGCVGAGTRTAVPAVIATANAASRAELKRVVGEALGQSNVLLAEDALTTSSELIIEPARPRDATGRLLQGRELTPPQRFHLQLTGTRCELVHESTQRRYPLRSVRCTPR
jgi:hypothetical protein